MTPFWKQIWEQLGSILDNFGVKTVAFWGSGGVGGTIWSPMAGQGAPGHQKTPKSEFEDPPPGAQLSDPKSPKSGKRVAQRVQRRVREGSRGLVRFWMHFWIGPGRPRTPKIDLPFIRERSFHFGADTRKSRFLGSFWLPFWSVWYFFSKF